MQYHVPTDLKQLTMLSLLLLALSLQLKFIMPDCSSSISTQNLNHPQ